MNERVACVNLTAVRVTLTGTERWTDRVAYRTYYAEVNHINGVREAGTDRVVNGCVLG